MEECVVVASQQRVLLLQPRHAGSVGVERRLVVRGVEQPALQSALRQVKPNEFIIKITYEYI